MASTRKIATRKGTIRWQARWREKGKDGSLISRQANFDTLKEAKTHAQKMGEEREGRGIADPSRHTVKSYLEGWLATLASRGDHAPTTLAGYSRHVGALVHHIGHVPLEKLSPLDLDRAYSALLHTGGVAAKPLSRQTVLHVHRMAHTALQQARKWRLISVNPASDATPPSVPFKQARGFTKDEIGAMLSAAENDAEGYCAQAILLTTGIRRSELLGLALDAVNLDDGIITIRRAVTEVKGKAVLRDVAKSAASRRTLSIPPAVVALLRQQKARVLEGAMQWGADYSRDPMFLFPGLAGAPMPPMSITLRLRQFRRRAGITGVQPVHGWRHAAATLMIADGADVKTAQSRLGHSTPVITLRLYADKVDERDRAAGEQLATYLPVAKGS